MSLGLTDYLLNNSFRTCKCQNEDTVMSNQTVYLQVSVSDYTQLNLLKRNSKEMGARFDTEMKSERALIGKHCRADTLGF